MPHTDLGRAEAAELLSSVFNAQLQGAAGVYRELDVEKFYSSNVAVVRTPDQPSGESGATEESEPALLESSVPLAVENASGQYEAVDLSLESAEEGLQPAQPLVDVGIPEKLDEGITLPETGISIELTDTSGTRAPSVLEGSTAFFPNVATDTDLTVAPTPAGMETLTQLRSPEAPTTQTFNLSLPSNADLHATSAGGAEVSRDGKPILVIPPPTALDADGQEVPVSLDTTDAGSLAVQAHPGPNSKYPILVDPLFEQPYVWLWNHSFAGMSDWYKEKNAGANSVPYAYTLSQEGYVTGVGFFPGLSIQTAVGTAPAWSQAKWYYAVPRYYSDTGVKPTSFIRTFSLHRLWYTVDAGIPRPITPNPVFRFGLWNVGSEQWTSEGYRYGTEGNLHDLDYTYNAFNPSEQVGAKIAVFMMDSGTETQLQYRELLAGEASIELSDKDAPSITHTATPSGWINNTPSGPLVITAFDPGLGIKEVVAKLPNSFQVGAQKGCTGIASNPCPREWVSSKAGIPPLNYEPQLMPQGQDWVQLEAVDPIGHRSPEEGHGLSEVKVKVDHTAPSLALSGTLTEQAKVGTNASQYTLKYNATDGDGAAPVAGTPFGSGGTGPGQMGEPKGIATDSSGNLWVVDRGNERVMKYDNNGNFLMQFGSAGSGDGQFSDPRGIAIAPNGTIWVSDMGNNNVQAFNSSGQFIRKITGGDIPIPDPYGVATGPGGVLWISDITSDQLFEFNENGTFIRMVSIAGGNEQKSATGLATDPSGNVWLVDYMANRVQKYSSTGSFLMQFGSTGTGNGQLENPVGIALAPSGNLLVTDSKSNRVQVFQPNGTYLRKFGSTGSGAGQLSTPVGIAAVAGNTAFVVDSGNHRVAKWTHADLDNQSGVVSTEVKVDGNLAEPKYAPGCATENCSITNREWLLKSNAYSTGQHNVKVIATDGVGLSTTKELTITTDTTPPQLAGGNLFFIAPDGWLQQKSYIYTPTASDTGGSGVSSMSLKIDGNVIKSTEQNCPKKECSASLIGTINMATYKGGAHSAELVATDVAGNTAKKAWTINIDPKGAVPIPEAVDTLEAVEETSPVNVIGEPQEEEEYEGTASGLGVEESTEGLVATGTQVPTTIGSTPAEGVTMEGLNNGAFANSCATEEEAEKEGSLTEEPEPVEPCMSQAEFEEADQGGKMGLTPLEVTPAQTAAGATENQIVGEASAVAANTESHVDTITRPLYDGGMIFKDIRDSSGPEVFSWEVRLEPDQELKAIDDKHAAVYYEGEHPAFGITAVPAHDAIGTTVPTKLTVSEDKIITLTVEHHNVAQEGHPFVYPIIGGAGWEGGFHTYQVEMPPPTPIAGEEEEEEEAEFESPPGEIGDRVFGLVLGPPVADSSAVPSQASQPNVPRRARAYNFDECGWTREATGLPAPKVPPKELMGASHDCHGEIPSVGPDYHVAWAMSMSGVFHYKYGHWVWTNEAPTCRKWGSNEPARINCYIKDQNVSNDHLDVVGDFKFPPGVITNSPQAMCYTLDGVLPIRPTSLFPGETVYHGRLHNPHYAVWPGEQCAWGHFPYSLGR